MELHFQVIQSFGVQARISTIKASCTSVAVLDKNSFNWLDNRPRHYRVHARTVHVEYRPTPTRYALLTGRSCWRSWLKKWVLMEQHPLLIDTDRLTIGKMFQSAGYTTGCQVGRISMRLVVFDSCTFH